MKWGTISLGFVSVLLWLGTFMSSGSLRMTLVIIAAIFSVFAIPAAWTVMTIYHNKWKAEGKGA